MDEYIRNLKRELMSDPNDFSLIKKLIRTLIRINDSEALDYFEQYLCYLIVYLHDKKRSRPHAWGLKEKFDELDCKELLRSWVKLLQSSLLSETAAVNAGTAYLSGLGINPAKKTKIHAYRQLNDTQMIVGLMNYTDRTSRHRPLRPLDLNFGPEYSRLWANQDDETQIDIPTEFVVDWLQKYGDVTLLRVWTQGGEVAIRRIKDPKISSSTIYQLYTSRDDEEFPTFNTKRFFSMLDAEKALRIYLEDDPPLDPARQINLRHNPLDEELRNLWRQLEAEWDPELYQQYLHKLNRLKPQSWQIILRWIELTTGLLCQISQTDFWKNAPVGKQDFAAYVEPPLNFIPPKDDWELWSLDSWAVHYGELGHAPGRIWIGWDTAHDAPRMSLEEVVVRTNRLAKTIMDRIESQHS
jgi:hypothetical protein